MDKNKVIDNTIKILEMGKTTPCFTLYFKVKVSNKDYKDYIMTNNSDTRFEDAYGHCWDEETIQEIREDTWNRYINSEGYIPNSDYGFIIYSKMIVVSNISYKMVYDIMSFSNEFGEFYDFCFDMSPYEALKYLKV